MLNVEAGPKLAIPCATRLTLAQILLGNHVGQGHSAGGMGDPVKVPCCPFHWKLSAGSGTLLYRQVQVEPSAHSRRSCSGAVCDLSALSLCHSWSSFVIVPVAEPSPIVALATPDRLIVKCI
jgi:hypothetical protein